MSDPIFTVKVTKDLSTSKLNDPAGLARALMAAMKEEQALTLAHIEEDYESFPGDGPTTMAGLRSHTGDLREANRASKPDGTLDTNITSTIGNPVVYAAIQEFGGQTKAHDIVARNAKALAFTPGGKFFSAGDFTAALKGLRGKRRVEGSELFVALNGIVFRRVVHHPGSDIPARQPIQRGIEDRLPEYAAHFESVIDQFFKN